MPKVVSDRLAINLFDIERIDPSLRALLRGTLDLTAPLRVDPRKGDEVAVEFICDLLRAATTCDVIRNQDRKAGDSPTRVYLNQGTGWVKLWDTAVLTETVCTPTATGVIGRVVLSPGVFSGDKGIVVPEHRGKWGG